MSEEQAGNCQSNAASAANEENPLVGELGRSWNRHYVDVRIYLKGMRLVGSGLLLVEPLLEAKTAISCCFFCSCCCRKSQYLSMFVLTL